MPTLSIIFYKANIILIKILLNCEGSKKIKRKFILSNIPNSINLLETP